MKSRWRKSHLQC